MLMKHEINLYRANYQGNIIMNEKGCINIIYVDHVPIIQVFNNS